MKAIIALLALSILSGCVGPKVQMYSGPHRDPEQQVEIKTTPPTSWNQLSIVAVDNKLTVNFFRFIFEQKWASSVYVLPGKHSLRVQCSNGALSCDGYLSWDAEGGATYIIDGVINENRLLMVVKDEVTGEAVVAFDDPIY